MLDHDYRSDIPPLDTPTENHPTMEMDALEAEITSLDVAQPLTTDHLAQLLRGLALALTITNINSIDCWQRKTIRSETCSQGLAGWKKNVTTSNNTPGGTLCESVASPIRYWCHHYGNGGNTDYCRLSHLDCMTVCQMRCVYYVLYEP